MVCITFLPKDIYKFEYWQKEDINILWSVTIFFMLIMIRRLRDISIEKFIDPDMPYPQRIKDDMQKYLYAIFAPYKFKEKAPQGSKQHYLLFNQIYSSLIIALIAGVIGFILNYLDPEFGLVHDLIGSGVGSAIPWFFFVILSYEILGIIGVLRDLSKDLKN
jgi:hypothetical protein